MIGVVLCLKFDDGFIKPLSLHIAKKCPPQLEIYLYHSTDTKETKDTDSIPEL